MVLSAPRSIGSSRNRPESQLFNDSLPVWAHPEVCYWFDTWREIRDACAGAKAIKTRGNYYLPQLDGMDDDEYLAYLDRATYYNFSGRTASALTGTIFRRREQIEGLSEALTLRLESISRKKENFQTFSEHVTDEIVKLGRVGVLLDLPQGPSTTPRPYLALYPAETILDWEHREIDGRESLSRVVLREVRLVRDIQGGAPKWVNQYRVLMLDDANMYWQELYMAQDGDAALDPKHLVARFQPTNRGTPLNYIPFHIFGAFTSSLAVEKPPLEDIVDLNMSHYRSYANLEHGRLFAGFPMYYVESAQGGEADHEFTLGAARVWQTPAGAKPGILELNGQGLKFLVDALDQKEAQAAALGGRMIGVRSTAVAESDNMIKLSERNEQSQLLKITRSLDHGFTLLLRWWASFQDVSAADVAKIYVDFNKDFLFEGVGAREFRAIHSMYKDGVVPIDVVFYYLKKGQAVPDWMDLKEFKSLLDKMESFPNNPDVQARKEGFPNATVKVGTEEKEKDRESEMDLLQTELESEEDRAKLTAAKPPAAQPVRVKPSR